MNVSDKEELNDNEFDALLDEIENDQNKATKLVIDNEEANVDWNQILNALRAKNTNFLKNLISSREVGVNAQNPNNGKTLLIYAVIIGNMDLVKGICFILSVLHT